MRSAKLKRPNVSCFLSRADSRSKIMVVVMMIMGHECKGTAVAGGSLEQGGKRRGYWGQVR